MPDGCEEVAEGIVFDRSVAAFLLGASVVESWSLGSTQCSNTRMFMVILGEEIPGLVGERERERELSEGEQASERTHEQGRERLIRSSIPIPF